MKRGRSFDTDFEAKYAAGLLGARDIPCEVRGLTLSEEPPFVTELWVLRDSDLPPAIEALHDRPRVEGVRLDLLEVPHQERAGLRRVLVVPSGTHLTPMNPSSLGKRGAHPAGTMGAGRL